MTCSSMMAAAKAGVEIIPASTNSNTDRYGTVQNSHNFQEKISRQTVLLSVLQKEVLIFPGAYRKAPKV